MTFGPSFNRFNFPKLQMFCHGTITHVPTEGLLTFKLTNRFPTSEFALVDHRIGHFIIKQHVESCKRCGKQMQLGNNIGFFVELWMLIDHK